MFANEKMFSATNKIFSVSQKTAGAAPAIFVASTTIKRSITCHSVLSWDPANKRLKKLN
jgi:hypothetical protein